jgi:hypothetical protein
MTNGSSATEKYKFVPVHKTKGSVGVARIILIRTVGTYEWLIWRSDLFSPE